MGAMSERDRPAVVGAVGAIGGVSEKIECFFDVCLITRLIA